MHRRLCIQKDLIELSTWINTLESLNNELDHVSIIEKQLIKIESIANTILAIRRKNILHTAHLCKYEKELRIEYEYGEVEYDLNRLKFHEQKRGHYLKLIEEYNTFKNQFYLLLRKYQRK